MFFIYLIVQGCSSVWLERLSDTQEVSGSSPDSPTYRSVREWLKRAVSKTVEQILFRVGSNPTLPAKNIAKILNFWYKVYILKCK